MSTASAGESPRWAWFAHYQMQFVIGAIAVVVISDISKLLDLAVIANALGWVATFCLLVFCVANSAVNVHLGMLCSRCLDAIPVDGAVQVKRRDWALRARHWMWAHPWRAGLTLIALLVLSFFGPFAWIGHYVLWPFFAVDTWMTRFHRRVVPWCPYCRGGGGGGLVELPNPVPTGSKVA